MISGTLVERWNALLEETGLSQQAAIERLIRFVVEQDETVRAMMLGQLQPTADLVKLALERWRDARPVRGSEIGEAPKKSRLGRN